MISHAKKGLKKKRIACTRKIRHTSFNNACIAAKKLKKESNLIAFPYRCKRCGFYHIGKPSFKDDPFLFWNNIFNKMSEHDIKALEENHK
jgi:hypothetical protein